MAWTDLKAGVAAVIKTNGNQEITGGLLQLTLNSIIDQVGANASFKGVATPSTSPGSPDGPVFYIASTQGTYANFGGFVLDGGFAVLSNVSGSWIGTKFLKTEMDTLGALENSIGVKQNITDESLTTTDKTIVGAVNELKNEINTKLSKNEVISEITDFASAGATIASASNKWLVNNSYVGSLIPVGDFKGRILEICGNKDTASSFSFLKTDDIVDGQTPNYSDGYFKVVTMLVDEIKRLIVPSDAEYLYVYIRSLSVYSNPKYIRVLNYSNIADETINLYNKKTDSINELLLFAPVFINTTTSEQGATMNATGADADGLLDAVRTDYISLSGINTLKVLGNKTLADGYVLKFKYTWYNSASDFVSVSAWTTETEIDIPKNAIEGKVRIVIQRYNGGALVSRTTPYDISLYGLSVASSSNKVGEIEDNANVLDSILKGLAPSEIIVATYNIGHFSGGASKNSTIKSANYDSKLALFKALMYDTINPKIIGIQEYSEVFGKDAGNISRKTKDVLLKDLAVLYEGVQRGYSCNSLHGNTYLSNIQINEFDCNQDAEVTHTTAIQATDYYYISADLYMNGKLVKFVSAHLVFDNNFPSVLQLAQINELVSKYSSYDRVLMVGDWNVYAQSDFNPFVTDGYTLANDGTIVTYPLTSKAPDNIIVKGLTITNAQAFVSDLSDHYPLIATVSI